MESKMSAQSPTFVSVAPVLPSKDVPALIRFYIDKLGFTLRFQDNTGDVRYAGVSRDSVMLHLQWHNPDEWDPVERPMLRFHIDGVEALFDEYKDKDVFHEHTALRDTPWGTREFAFYDAHGNGLTFFVNTD